jgi:serine/threonine protein kinase
MDQVIKSDFATIQLEMSLPWSERMTDIIQYVRSRNIWHGDIKPQNLLVRRKEIYLTDFGSAQQRIATDLSYTEAMHRSHENMQP